MSPKTTSKPKRAGKRAAPRAASTPKAFAATGDQIRQAAKTVYGTHPHGLAYAERIARAVDGNEWPAFAAAPRTAFEQTVLDNLLLSLGEG